MSSRYSIALVLFPSDVFPLLGVGDTGMDSDAANLSDIQSGISGQELPRDCLGTAIFGLSNHFAATRAVITMGSSCSRAHAPIQKSTFNNGVDLD